MTKETPMADAVVVTYQGIEITYHEQDNLWVFELRGRERKVGSLAQAKEAIDKPAPEGKKKFERIAAYKQSYNGMIKGEITSLAERDYAWFSVDGKRTKEMVCSLYVANSDNAALIDAIATYEKERNRLYELIRETSGKLTRVDLSGCE
jgi:hypothetical protein